MAKRKSHRKARCPVARPLDAIGDRWSLLIVRDAFEGMKRFGEFQESLGVAKNILSNRLKKLVEHGVLDALSATDGRPRHEYVLTAKGRGLFPLLVALRQLGEDFFFNPGERLVLLVDKRSGHPVRRVVVHSHGGQIVGHEETLVIAAPSAKCSERTR
ncbi:MAG: helix-turn-helix transcriptional regulator [Chthoniobacterales bacterium]|nr:helix-turn-helix transcriptional regulator [Chthoniobacterales bacterium]